MSKKSGFSWFIRYPSMWYYFLIIVFSPYTIFLLLTLIFHIFLFLKVPRFDYWETDGLAIMGFLLLPPIFTLFLASLFFYKGGEHGVQFQFLMYVASGSFLSTLVRLIFVVSQNYPQYSTKSSSDLRDLLDESLRLKAFYAASPDFNKSKFKGSTAEEMDDEDLEKMMSQIK